MTKILEIRDISFGYGNDLVLNNISLVVEKGELFCLMGSNGCGKSTAINCILGENKLINGSISILGENIKDLKIQELAKKISYVPQSHRKSFPFLVKEIVLMGRTVHSKRFHSPDEKDEIIVENVLKEVGILHLANKPCTQISGGEMQMVSLARSLVQESPLIILDEPTAHLDFYNELLFLEKISSLVQEENRSIFMATHSPNHAFYFENIGLKIRVGLMLKGELFAVGRPSDVLTEANIKKVYRAETKIVEFENNKQIMPIKTIVRGN